MVKGFVWLCREVNVVSFSGPCHVTSDELFVAVPRDEQSEFYVVAPCGKRSELYMVSP
jgi:hypothetical protein